MKIDLCKLLGVEEGEEFKIEGCNFEYRYRVYKNRIQNFDVGLKIWDYSSLSVNALVTSEIIKIPKKKQFTDDELCILRNINKEYKWIARDNNGSVCIFSEKPYREDDAWGNVIRTPYNDFNCYNHLFDQVLWEDEEPVYIDDYVER